MPGLDQPRSTARFNPEGPFAATFIVNGISVQVNVRDLSVTGAQIEHPNALRPGTRGALVVESLNAKTTVVWSRLSAPGVYRSGLRIHEQLDIVAATIRDLLGRGLVRKQGEETLRKRQEALLERERATARLIAPAVKVIGPTEEQVLLIRQARERMLMHPEDAVKWYNRARVTASEDHMRIAESGRPNREDVLAVWEYLERSIDLRFVVQALS
jgi:hypothetical protein